MQVQDIQNLILIYIIEPRKVFIRGLGTWIEKNIKSYGTHIIPALCTNPNSIDWVYKNWTKISEYIDHVSHRKLCKLRINKIIEKYSKDFVIGKTPGACPIYYQTIYSNQDLVDFCLGALLKSEFYLDYDILSNIVQNPNGTKLFKAIENYKQMGFLEVLASYRYSKIDLLQDAIKSREWDMISANPSCIEYIEEVYENADPFIFPYIFNKLSTNPNPRAISILAKFPDKMNYGHLAKNYTEEATKLLLDKISNTTGVLNYILANPTNAATEFIIKRLRVDKSLLKHSELYTNPSSKILDYIRSNIPDVIAENHRDKFVWFPAYSNLISNTNRYALELLKVLMKNSNLPTHKIGALIFLTENNISEEQINNLGIKGIISTYSSPGCFRQKTNKKIIKKLILTNFVIFRP